jgi:hypothetical protein
LKSFVHRVEKSGRFCVVEVFQGCDIERCHHGMIFMNEIVACRLDVSAQVAS